MDSRARSAARLPSVECGAFPLPHPATHSSILTLGGRVAEREGAALFPNGVSLPELPQAALQVAGDAFGADIVVALPGIGERQALRDQKAAEIDTVRIEADRRDFGIGPWVGDAARHLAAAAQAHRQRLPRRGAAIAGGVGAAAVAVVG